MNDSICSFSYNLTFFKQPHFLISLQHSAIADNSVHLGIQTLFCFDRPQFDVHGVIAVQLQSIVSTRCPAWKTATLPCSFRAAIVGG